MKKLVKIEKAVPDTSVIIEGLISKQISKLSIKKLIIHEAVLAELESQANKNRETGYLGLEEVEKLRKLSKKHKFEIEYKGSRPGDFEIKFAKSGEIDSLIRELAYREKATLITADIVQSKVAKAKGIKVFLYKFENKKNKLLIEKFFDNETYSIQIKQDCRVLAKKGKPGKWKYKLLNKVSVDEVKQIMDDLVDNVKLRQNSFIETEKRGNTILQIDKYSVLIVRPPLSNGFEINVKKQNRRVLFNKYKINKNKLKNALIVGPPQNGKTTFVQSLVFELLKQKNKISMIESARNSYLPNEISRYSSNRNNNGELLDILLITKPDYIIFDEIKSSDDFKLYYDLKLSGLNIIGVFSAGSTEDALQKISKKTDAEIKNTIIFIKEGFIKSIK